MQLLCCGILRVAGRSAGKNGLVHNLGADRLIELRDETAMRPMKVREMDATESVPLWGAVAAYPTYADYQAQTRRQIPVFVAAP
jgi:F420H(2)-dependent quinone reductase